MRDTEEVKNVCYQFKRAGIFGMFLTLALPHCTIQLLLNTTFLILPIVWYLVNKSLLLCNSEKCNFQSTRAKQVQQGGCSHTITSDLLLALVTPSEPKVPHLSLQKKRSVPYTQQRFRSFKPVSYQKTKTPAEYPDYFGNLFTLEIYKNFSPKI